jgi:hypothetical protein
MSTAVRGSRIDATSAVSASVSAGIRRRAPMRVIAGLLVIAVGFVVGAVVVTGLDKSVEVLALARSVSAGSVLTTADLATTRIVADDQLHVVPVARRPAVVGQTAAVPLVAGSLLTMEQLGAVTDPGPGQAFLAVGLKAGHTPAGLSPGATVLVLVVANSPGSATASVVQAPAVVRDVAVPDASNMTVVTLQLASDAAVRVASAAGDVTVIVQGR